MPRDLDLPVVPQDVQNLLKLADALESERAGFEWNFPTVYRKTRCGTVGCAIGMACYLGMMPHGFDEADGSDHWDRAEFVFGLTGKQVEAVFSNSCRGNTKNFYGCSDTEVTAAMVAAELRRLASEKLSAPERALLGKRG